MNGMALSCSLFVMRSAGLFKSWHASREGNLEGEGRVRVDVCVECVCGLLAAI